MAYLAMFLAAIWLVPLIAVLALTLGCWASPRLRGWCVEQLIGAAPPIGRMPQESAEAMAGGV